MKKEKQVKSYQRRTKSGKMVTVKAHTAKYDAAEKAKEAAKKKGAGSELEERMKKKPTQLELPFKEMDEKGILEDVKKEETGTKETPKTTKKTSKENKAKDKSTPKKTTTPKSSDTGEISAADFKEWYHGTGSAADKKVAKMLRAKLGRAGYKKLEDEAIDNYSSRGHLKLFKQIAPEQYSKEKGAKQLAGAAKAQKAVAEKMGAKDAAKKFDKIAKGAKGSKTTGTDYSKITDKALQKKITNYVQEATNWEHSEGAKDYTWKDTLKALSDPGEKSVRYNVDKMLSESKSSTKSNKSKGTTVEEKLMGELKSPLLKKQMQSRINEKKLKSPESKVTVVKKESGMPDTTAPRGNGTRHTSMPDVTGTKSSSSTSRYASGAKLNADGTFVSEKDYQKSLAYKKRKGARISPEEVKAIKMYEKANKM